MLSLLLLPFFADFQPLCASEGGEDPIAKIINFVITHSAEFAYGAATAGATIVSTIVINGGNSAYTWMFPTEEQKMNKKEAQERQVYLDAKIKFRECLQASLKDSIKDDRGIPTDCQETARQLIICGGFNDVVAMTKK